MNKSAPTNFNAPVKNPKISAPAGRTKVTPHDPQVGKTPGKAVAGFSGSGVKKGKV